MLFWYVGGSIWIFRYVFKDPAVDLRPLALGAILPDLIDKPLAFLIAPDAFDSHRLYGHTVVFALATMTLGIILTNRRTENRKRAVALAVGLLSHLLLAGLWTSAEVLFWPAFGLEFPPMEAQTAGALFSSTITDAVALGLELVGLVYVAFLWRGAGLNDAGRRRRLIRTGRITVEDSE